MTIISSNVSATSFGANSEFFEVTSLGVVSSNNSTAAVQNGGYTDVQLLNFGGITSAAGYSIDFDSLSTGTIVNEIGGYIGGYAGINIESKNVSFFNFGTVTGVPGWGVRLGDTSSGNTIDNRADIHGGILDTSNIGGNQIVNSGIVEGLDGTAIFLSTAPGKVTHVLNSGTIIGMNTSIFSNTGTVDLSNTGKISGAVVLSASAPNDADAIYNKGVIEGAVFLGGGNDIFVGAGGTSGVVYGEAGNDHLTGGAQADTLNGGDNNDRISGGGGYDTLTGGAQSDAFLFGTNFNTAGIDFITDMEHGVDVIELSHSIFRTTNLVGNLAKGMFAVGAHAHDANDRIIYNPNNGWLVYDSNGYAAGGEHHFATLDPHLVLSRADFLIT